MYAAVLCPGPSLARTWPGDRPYDLRIGVNRAAVAFQCDYAAVLDSPLLRAIGRAFRGDPRLLTRGAHRPKYSTRPGPDVESLPCPVRQWDLFTATAALVLAAQLGAELIDVYGADWTPNAPDFDGVNVAERRTAERFEKEREVWADVVAWLAARNCHVARIL